MCQWSPAEPVNGMPRLFEKLDCYSGFELFEWTAVGGSQRDARVRGRYRNLHGDRGGCDRNIPDEGPCTGVRARSPCPPRSSPEPRHRHPPHRHPRHRRPRHRSRDTGTRRTGTSGTRHQVRHLQLGWVCSCSRDNRSTQAKPHPVATRSSGSTTISSMMQNVSFAPIDALIKEIFAGSCPDLPERCP